MEQFDSIWKMYRCSDLAGSFLGIRLAWRNVNACAQRNWSRGSEAEGGGTHSGEVVGSHVLWGMAGLGQGFALYWAHLLGS